MTSGLTSEMSEDLLLPSVWVTAVSGAQVLVFVFLYEAAAEVYVSNVGPMNRIFGFGMQMDISLYLLSILAAVHALAHRFLTAMEQKLIFTVLCTAVWMAYWGNVAEVVPNRFALLSVLGMLSFLSGVLLNIRQTSLKFE